LHINLPKNNQHILIKSSCPSLADYVLVLRKNKISLDKKVLGSMEIARNSYLEEARKRPIYGFSTGLGGLQTRKVSYTYDRLLLEHASGVGIPLNEDASRLVLFTRIVQLSRGYSPVRPQVVEYLAELLSRDIVPVIPRYGSVGASGDLAPLSHLVLAAMGRGYVWYNGKIFPSREILQREGIRPIQLQEGEALSLINGTSYSVGVLLYSLLCVYALFRIWLDIIATSIKLSTFNTEHYCREVYAVKKHSYPRTLLGDIDKVCEEDIGEGARRSKEALQDPYSIRCIPQVVSSTYTSILHTAEIALREACSPADNPIVIGSRVVHQCSFHGIHVAQVSDYLAISLSTFANCAERRIEHLLESSPRSKPYLGEEDSPSGFMLAQYTAASRAAYIRHLASPHSIHSIPTSGLQEDFVPMSANASVRLLDLIDALLDIAAVELAVTSRLAYLRGIELSKYREVYSVVKKYYERPLSDTIELARRTIEEKIEELLKTSRSFLELASSITIDTESLEKD